MSYKKIREITDAMNAWVDTGLERDTVQWAIEKCLEKLESLETAAHNQRSIDNSDIAERLSMLADRIAAIESTERHRQGSTLFPDL